MWCGTDSGRTDGRIETNIPQQLDCDDDIIYRIAKNLSWAKIWEFPKWQWDVIDDIRITSQSEMGCSMKNYRIICHYSDVIMGAIASQITSFTIVYSTVYAGGDQRKHQSSAFLVFVQGIHRWPVNSPHKWPVTRKMFPFDDVIM